VDRKLLPCVHVEKPSPGAAQAARFPELGKATAALGEGASAGHNLAGDFGLMRLSGCSEASKGLSPDLCQLR
jgi:hypothetical protein